MRRRSTGKRATLALLCAVGLALLGVALLAAGLPTDGPWLQLPAPWRVPLGTALGFVVAGIGIGADARHYRPIAIAAALTLLAGVVAAIVLHGGSPASTAAIDAQSLGGVPAPSTALCLLLAGLSLLLTRRSPVVAWSLGVAIFALAGLGVLGRQLELSSIFVGMMPIASALGCAILGIGLALHTSRRFGHAVHGDGASRYTPYATGATCLLATLLFWQSLVAQQAAELQRVVEMTAVGSLAELGAFVTSVTRSLEHIGDEWNRAGRLPAAQWRDQCRLLLERLGGPRAVEWIDDELDVVYVVAPPKTLAGGTLAAMNPSPPLDDDARRALAAARAARTAAATSAFDYDTNQAAFRLVVPLRRNGEPDGFASTLFLIDEMLDDLLAARIHDYVITVHEGDRQLYGPRMPAALAACPWCRPYTLDLPGGRRWEIAVRPSAELRAIIETSFPQMILISGALISLLLTAMLQLLERERRTARDLARANRSLHEEVASRRTAEQEIRTLATELEQRVRDRTIELANSNTALRTENALRQRAQTTLESANANLRHFASFVSHELRQPLATMALWAELLQTNPDVGLNERGQGYLKQLRAAIDRMTGFLEAQLRLARITYTQPTLEEDVDVTALAREVVGDGTLGLHQAGATVEIDDVPTIHADSGQFRQLFRNLIENAVKYRRADVPLVIRIAGSIVERDGGRHCEIRVSDNGQGFAETDAEKIFDLFEQLPGRKSAGKGSGVGLAICRRIVEHHGGTLRAEGRPGLGATFIIDLPLGRCEGRDEHAPESIQP